MLSFLFAGEITVVFSLGAFCVAFFLFVIRRQASFGF